jgi:hypothetical protein
MTKTFLLSILALCFLAACGVKPGHVKAPDGAHGAYPRVYPAE